MEITTKQGKYTTYQHLIQNVRTSYPEYQESTIYEKNQLVWCDACKKEINLWSYWQGSLNADIMLVGQDWGCPYDKAALQTMSQIEQANKGEAYDYLSNNPSQTDKNLIALFQLLGKDITTPCDDLFFTNFVLGYRTHGTSGNYQRDWAEHDSSYFKKLTETIEPKVILCLGRATFRAVLSALAPDIKPRIGNYNRFIESDRNPIQVTLPSNATSHIFALAHCGVMGTLNRNGKKNLTLDKQLEDWKKILPYL